MSIPAINGSMFPMNALLGIWIFIATIIPGFPVILLKLLIPGNEVFESFPGIPVILLSVRVTLIPSYACGTASTTSDPWSIQRVIRYS